MPLTCRTGDCLGHHAYPKLIVHVVNDISRWGAGFSGSLGRLNPLARRSFLEWPRRPADSFPPYAVGRVLVWPVGSMGSDVRVAHLCAQRGVRGRKNPVPLDLAALDTCLAALTSALAITGCGAVVMPKIGCGLAGGSWRDVGPLVERHLGHLDVTVYDLDGR